MNLSVLGDTSAQNSLLVELIYSSLAQLVDTNEVFSCFSCS